MKKGIILTLILVINLSFILAISYPNAFHGTITVENGQNPDGQIVIGKLNGVATGSAVISNGLYDLVVVDYVGQGGEIEFYINNEKAGETAEFEIFGVTELNLTFDEISSNPEDCGNNVCDFGECSSCAIDCGISDCENNGRCDIEIGEDCVSSPEDCGICEYCGDGICNNGETCSSCSIDCGSCSSSSSSSSGGGSSSSGGGNNINNTPINLNLEENNNDENSGEILGIDELNEIEEQKNTNPGITGAVIGFVKTRTGIGLIAAIVILMLGAVVITSKNKNIDKK